ncbi:hypothetical protein PRIPAC_95480 [Pristionchus pacificus]|uniref:Uncharacterized protein n=1 Tax=Pristionchus pacificus TaxID=54126 RepID=A0A2A6B3B4_PRIPA|nr:hypothetical protein PRIPAC_95480 [Pristionchus pacificus]|eukprot:PDM60375.1 hypothetical protein PRIPAC_54200 [Pristionchus pacificus]
MPIMIPPIGDVFDLQRFASFFYAVCLTGVQEVPTRSRCKNEMTTMEMKYMTFMLQPGIRRQ